MKEGRKENAQLRRYRQVTRKETTRDERDVRKKGMKEEKNEMRENNTYTHLST
jgi:hypothetical protein